MAMAQVQTAVPSPLGSMVTGSFERKHVRLWVWTNIRAKEQVSRLLLCCLWTEPSTRTSPKGPETAAAGTGVRLRGSGVGSTAGWLKANMGQQSGHLVLKHTDLLASLEVVRPPEGGGPGFIWQVIMASGGWFSSISQNCQNTPGFFLLTSLKAAYLDPRVIGNYQRDMQGQMGKYRGVGF